MRASRRPASLGQARCLGLSICALACTLTLPLAAQKTHTVGGSNPTFGTLTAAVASSTVRDGDILLVRRGFYTAPNISKALTILGDPGSALVLAADKQLPGFGVPMVLSNIGKGRSLTLRNFTVYYKATLGGFIRVLGCQGRVHLENITVRFSLTSINRGSNGDTEIRDCSAVSMTRCTLDGLTRVQNSTLSAIDCNFKGWNGSINFKGIASPATAGIDAIKGSNVTLARCTSIGGNGARTNTVFVAPAPGVACDTSTLTLSGDFGALFQAGTLTNSGAPAAGGAGVATLFLDPRVVLKPSGTAKSHAGFLRAFVRDQALVALTGGDLGQSAAAELRSRKGDLYHLVGGLLRNDAPISVPSFGGLFWLDPGLLVFLASGSVGASDTAKVTTRLPTATALRGLSLGIQAVNGPARGPFSLSNVGVMVVR